MPPPRYSVPTDAAAKSAAINGLKSVPSLRWLLLLGLLTGCAHIRPDTYTTEACYNLKREARKAGTWQVGASSVALGLGAGGAVLPLVQESKEAQVGLALGAVLFGAVGLAAGYYEDEANRDMMENCPARGALPSLATVVAEQ